MGQDDLLIEWQTEVFYSGIIASTSNEISSRCFMNDYAIMSIFTPLVKNQLGCNQLAFEISYTMLTWNHCVDSTRVKFKAGEVLCHVNPQCMLSLVSLKTTSVCLVFSQCQGHTIQPYWILPSLHTCGPPPCLLGLPLVVIITALPWSMLCLTLQDQVCSLDYPGLKDVISLKLGQQQCFFLHSKKN